MASSELKTFGDVRVDAAAERVWKAGQPVELEPKAFGVLRFLMDHPGRLVSKQELLDAVWKGIAVTDNALTRVVAQLHRAIGDDARDARYIETVPTRGYRFIAEVRDEPQEASIADAPVEPALAIPRESPQRAGGWPGAAFGAALGATVVIVFIAIGMVWTRVSGPSAAMGAASMGVGDEGMPSAASRMTAKYAQRLIDNTLISQTTFSIDLDAFPSFSPDGTMLVYSSVRRGNLNLFVKTFAPGGQERQVTDDSQQNVQPNWSPDGQFLAYHSIARGGIWAIPITGGTMRQVADVGSGPRWAPDGKSLVYQTGEVHSLDTPSLQEAATLQIASFPEGTRRPLTKPGQPIGGHGQPSWSADGSRVVFTVRHPGPAEIWTVSVADGALTRLITCEQLCSNPTYDFDGRGLFYTTGEPQGGIWRVALSADGRKTEGNPVLLYAPIDSEVSSLAVRRDEPRLAFGLVTTRSNLESIAVSPQATAAGAAATAARARAEQADGGPFPSPQPVTQDTSSRNMWPAISPDGRLVAYVSRRSGTGHQIYVAGVDGSNARQLTLTRVAATGLQGWMPSGEEVTYMSFAQGRMSLIASSITTGRVRELRQMPSIEQLMRSQMMHPRLMPDASDAVYAKVIDGIPNLWLADRQITNEPEGASFPSVSRDGRWIAFEAIQGGDMQLGLVSSEGGDARLLTSGRGLTWAHSFAADGERIAVAYRRDGLWRIGAIPRAGGAIVPLSAPAPANAFMRYPEWSPREERIIYEHAKTTGNIWLARLPSSPGGWTAGTRN